MVLSDNNPIFLLNKKEGSFTYPSLSPPPPYPMCRKILVKQEVTNC